MPLAVEYVRQACLGLSEVHSLGFIHRDVKPANLFLAAHPTLPAQIRLIDFGVAKWTGDTAADLSLTNTSMLLGSAPYVSPEQLRDSACVDARTDIWALGVVLFELLLGSRPFGGSSAADLCAQILMRPAPVLRSERSEIAPELDAIVRRCLEKSRLDRFSSALELYDALRCFSLQAHATPWNVSDRSALGLAPEPSLRSSAGREPASEVVSPGAYRVVDGDGAAFAKASARSEEPAPAAWPSPQARQVALRTLPRSRRSRWWYPVAGAVTMLGATLLPLRHDSSPVAPSTLGTPSVPSSSVTGAAGIGSAAASGVSTARALELATSAADSSQRSEPSTTSVTTWRPAGVDLGPAPQLPAVTHEPDPSARESPSTPASKRPPAPKRSAAQTRRTSNDEVDFGI